MIIDEMGLPKVTGASDKQDSAAVAGMMVAFDYPNAAKMPLIFYMLRKGREIPDRDDPNIKHTFPKTIYVRHPAEYKFDLSRDQYVLLIAGMSKQRDTIDPILIDRKYVNGKDLMMPVISGHERRCKGLKAFFWQDWWLRGDMWFSAKFKPMEELNQLLTILWCHPDDKYIVKYCKMNPQWEASLNRYWWEGYVNKEGKREGDWRQEKAFCEHVIYRIKLRIANAEASKLGVPHVS